MEDLHRSQRRRRPTIAKEWQLAVLKRLQSESGNPTEEQRSAAAAETGLDEKWVRNWFVRQRSKLAARNRKTLPATTEQPPFRTVPTFRLQLGAPSRRCISTPLPPSTDTQAPRSVSAPVPLNNPTVSHTTSVSTYSRNPLCNRYPDFSQFFRPRVHERFHTIALTDQNRLVAHPGPSGGSLNPFLLGGHPISSSPLTNPHPCPVAFSMRLVDLVDCSSLARHPAVSPPGYHT